MTLWEISFRTQYDYPFIRMTQRYPGLPISMWCLFGRELVQVPTVDEAILESIQGDIRKAGRCIEEWVEGRESRIFMLKCTCDTLDSPWNIWEPFEFTDAPPAVYKDGWGYFRLIGFDESKTKDLFRELNSRGPTELIRKRELTLSVLPSSVWVNSLFAELTGKQMDAVLKAHRYGYYTSPPPDHDGVHREGLRPEPLDVRGAPPEGGEPDHGLPDSVHAALRVRREEAREADGEGIRARHRGVHGAELASGAVRWRPGVGWRDGRPRGQGFRSSLRASRDREQAAEGPDDPAEDYERRGDGDGPDDNHRNRDPATPGPQEERADSRDRREDHLRDDPAHDDALVPRHEAIEGLPPRATSVDHILDEGLENEKPDRDRDEMQHGAGDEEVARRLRLDPRGVAEVALGPLGGGWRVLGGGRAGCRRRDRPTGGRDRI